MYQHKKVGDNLVAVSYDPTEIFVRKSGRKNVNDAKRVVVIADGTLHVNLDALKEMGLQFSTDPKIFTVWELQDTIVRAGWHFQYISTGDPELDDRRHPNDIANRAYDLWLTQKDEVTLLDCAKIAYKEAYGEEVAV